MAKQTNRLSARTVASIIKPGLHADGDGLYLVVDKSGAKRWSYIFQWDKKRTEMGLGNLASVPLADARVKAAEARRIRADGRNPIEVRTVQQAARDAAAVTFGTYADEYAEEATKALKNAKHKAQWKMTLKVYAAPIRGKRLDEIDTADILGVLKPIWDVKHETASRLLNRIERVLDAAKVKGYRSGENPARWRGHLDKLLKKRSSKKVKHHAALPYYDVPAFVKRLRMSKGMGALALEFTILTASRTSESRFAVPGEFDLKANVWTVPPERMKGEREHRVPLCPRAAEIVSGLIDTAISPYIFAGMKKGAPISEGTMTKAIRTAGGGSVTTHGFRSSFKDWATEMTNFPNELSEAALAHLIGDETERAYRRSDALEKRRKLMKAWEAFVSTNPGGVVIPLARRQRP